MFIVVSAVVAFVVVIFDTQRDLFMFLDWLSACYESISRDEHKY